MMLTIHSLTVT